MTTVNPSAITTIASNNNTAAPVTLASINLTGCTYQGRVLDPLETDRAIEEQYFAGWRDYLAIAIHRVSQGATNSQLQFNVVRDRDVPVLENVGVKPFLLVTGDATWRDVSIVTTLRNLMTWSFPQSTHDEATFDGLARVGVALRVQDGRRHYFCGFVGGRSLVIAVRENAQWIVLNSVDLTVDVERYHQLEARCEGDRFDVLLDGQLRLTVRDPQRAAWSGGPAGIYGTTPCRFRDVTVTTTAHEQTQIRERQTKIQRDLEQAQRQTPQAVLTHQITVPIEADATLQIGGRPFSVGGILCGNGDCVFAQWARNGRGGLLAVDLSGQLRWRRELGAASRVYTAVAHDVDGDGATELVVLGDGELLVLDGATGQTRAAAPYPQRCPFLGRRQGKAPLRATPKVLHMQGANKPARIVILEEGGWGGHTLWGFDHELRHRWTHHNTGARFGHDVTGYDIDGDGREEIVAGYYALNDDGQCVWTVEDHDHIYMGEHADHMAVDVFEPGGKPKMFAACGNGGVLMLDAASGKKLQHLRWVGHAQDVHTGNFRHDRPGRECWVWTDWGCHGIYFLFDGEGNVLHRFQPDPRVTYAWTVRWWPDGRDLMLMQGTRETWGLWDSQGRRVVDFTKTAGIPLQTLPTDTGLPVRPQFVVDRLTGSSTDCLLMASGNQVLVFGRE